MTEDAVAALAEALYNAPIWVEDEDELQTPADWREGETKTHAIARNVLPHLPEGWHLTHSDAAEVERLRTIEKAARKLLSTGVYGDGRDDCVVSDAWAMAAVELDVALFSSTEAASKPSFGQMVMQVNDSLAAENERLRAALAEFVQWADDGEDDDGIVARGKAALSSTEAVSNRRAK